jgi:hypothetical protein
MKLLKKTKSTEEEKSAVPDLSSFFDDGPSVTEDKPETNISIETEETKESAIPDLSSFLKDAIAEPENPQSDNSTDSIPKEEIQSDTGISDLSSFFGDDTENMVSQDQKDEKTVEPSASVGLDLANLRESLANESEEKISNENGSNTKRKIVGLEDEVLVPDNLEVEDLPSLNYEKMEEKSPQKQNLGDFSDGLLDLNNDFIINSEPNKNSENRTQRKKIKVNPKKSENLLNGKVFYLNYKA